MIARVQLAVPLIAVTWRVPPRRIKSMLKGALLSILLVAQPSGEAGPIIRCMSMRGPPVTITLAAFEQFGASLDCISADFIADITPCAPTNGFGLSSGMGTARLVGITTRWQDYADHRGGVVSSVISTTHMNFRGGQYHGDQRWTDQWDFHLDRVSGAAVLSIQAEGASSGSLQQVADYTCDRVELRF